MERKKLVVLGTGWSSFALLNVIDKKKYGVFVVNPRNHFLFTPLLASTTMGTLEFRYSKKICNFSALGMASLKC